MMIPNRPNSKLKHDKLPLAGRGFNRTYPANSLQPELVLDAGENYYRKDGSRDSFSNTFTHSRAGNATVLDADGVLKWAPHNLLTYSEDFSNAAWSGFSGASIVTANYAEAPDGSITADRIVWDNVGNDFRYQDNLPVSTGAEYTFAFWVKSTDGVEYTFATRTGGGPGFLADQTHTATSEWQFITRSAIRTTQDDVGFDFRTAYGSDASGDILIWGAHLYRSDLGGMQAVPVDERGLASSSTYLPTTSAARYLPRRNAYTHVDGVLTGPYIQHESAAATNLVTYSEDFTDASWAKANTATLAVDAIGPDGETSAVTLVDSGATGTNVVFLQRSVTVSTSTNYTFSCFLKADQLSWVFFNFENFTTPANGNVYINLSDGSLGSVASGYSVVIESFGSGWYRVAVSFTTDSTDTSGVIRIGPATANNNNVVNLDGTSSILIYGAQFEQGSIPTSYIPTNGSTATRAAETLTIDNPPWPATVEATGTELVTNGTFDTDTDWTKGTGWTISGGMAVSASATGILENSGYAIAFPTNSLVLVSFDITSYTGGSLRPVLAGGTAVNGDFASGLGSYSQLLYNVNNSFIRFQSSSFDGSLDNISVKEITPRGLAIAMDGLMTYADTGLNDTAFFVRWDLDASNYIRQRISTLSAAIGRFDVLQNSSGTFDFRSSADDAYSPGINVPFSIASRHGDNFINGAVDGTALTEDTTPTILPALSATPIQIGSTFNGYIDTLRIWPVDIGDAGIASASNSG